MHRLSFSYLFPASQGQVLDVVGDHILESGQFCSSYRFGELEGRT